MVLIDQDKLLSLKQKITPSKLAEYELDEEPSAKKIDYHFLFGVTSKEIASFMVGECPQNTTKNNKWALRNFEA